MTTQGRNLHSWLWVVAIALSYCLLVPGRAAAVGDPFFVELVEGKDLLVVAFDDGLVRLLSVPDLVTVGELDTGLGARLEAVAVSGNGRWLAVSSRDGGVDLWDLGSRLRQLSIPDAEPGGERSFLFHPRDDVLFLFQEGRLQLWDLQRNAVTETVRGIRTVQRMSISPEGRYLAVAGWCHTGCGDFGLCVLGLEERLVLAGALGVFGRQGSEPVADLAYTPRHRVSITDADGQTRLFFAGRLTGGGVLPMAHYPRSAIRSAPRRDPTRHQSLDGEWAATLSADGSRLFLYHRNPEDPDRDFDLEKMVALP